MEVHELLTFWSDFGYVFISSYKSRKVIVRLFKHISDDYNDHIVKVINKVRSIGIPAPEIFECANIKCDHVLTSKLNSMFVERAKQFGNDIECSSCICNSETLTYMIMEYFEGHSLTDTWSVLKDSDRNTILSQMIKYFKMIRTIKYDRIVTAVRHSPKILGPLPTCLAHNDYHIGNIIISGTPPNIVGIIDWECAGYYPEYYEIEKYRDEEVDVGSRLLILDV
jgi:serine/threonine protein kinase